MIQMDLKGYLCILKIYMISMELHGYLWIVSIPKLPNEIAGIPMDSYESMISMNSEGYL